MYATNSSRISKEGDEGLDSPSSRLKAETQVQVLYWKDAEKKD